MQIFGLCGFAVAQPLFALLGRNATFFVVHDTSGLEIVLFCLVTLLVPPAVVLGLVELATFASPRAGAVAMASAVGALAALTLVPMVERSVGLSTVAFVVAMLGLTLLGALAYARLVAARTFTAYLAPMPVLFAVVFLFVSPVNDLLTDPSSAAAVELVEGRTTPVVMLVLDELPLGALLRPDGELDGERFPGFAELASISTWYPNATTVAPYTNIAMPALLSGSIVDDSEIPVAANIPRSVFTALGGSHALAVQETVTRLCPRSLCSDAGSADDASDVLVEDSTIAYLHTILPQGLADAFGLPSIDSGWSGFGEQQVVKPSGEGRDHHKWFEDVQAEVNRSDEARRVDRFLGSIQPGTTAFSYLHLNVPHAPWRYLPDGRRYERTAELPRGALSWTQWGGDQEQIDLSRQRLLLQLEYADRIVSRLIERLRNTGQLDHFLMVVASDHGVSFTAGRDRRAVPVDAVTMHEVLPVPLFIKYPGSPSGAIDEQPAQLVDVLPTIADALSLGLPADWEFDGRSLLDSGVSDESIPFGVDFALIPRPRGIDPTRMANAMDAAVGRSVTNDIYAYGRFGASVGSAAPRDPEPSAGLVRLWDAASFRRVDLGSEFVPALVRGGAQGVSRDAWVAIGVNGTVAGDGPILSDGAFQVVVDPRYFRNGANDVDVYEIGADGTTLRKLRVAGG